MCYTFHRTLASTFYYSLPRGTPLPWTNYWVYDIHDASRLVSVNEVQSLSDIRTAAVFVH